MSLAIAPPIVTCCVPGRTGTTQPLGHERSEQLADRDTGLRGHRPLRAVELEVLQPGRLEHQPAAELRGVAVAAAHPTRDRPATAQRQPGARAAPMLPGREQADRGAARAAPAVHCCVDRRGRREICRRRGHRLSSRRGHRARTRSARRARRAAATGRGVAAPPAPRRRPACTSAPYRARHAANGMIVSGRHGTPSTLGSSNAQTQ